MKNIHYIIAFLFLGCNSQTIQPEKVQQIDSTANTTFKNNIDLSKYYTDKDTITITTEIGEKLKFAKAYFNSIVDKHPEFFQTYPENPDHAFYNHNDEVYFFSELGQDTYYELYAYFLKQRNGIEKYKIQRKKLIDIYSNINSLFQMFEYGGTYFTHQWGRILGYAEYSVYLLPKKASDIRKSYDITKQKELYIKSLRQLIDDESKIDFITLREGKIPRKNELNKLVDELDKLITDNFYLRRAQEFQYEHYEYY